MNETLVDSPAVVAVELVNDERALAVIRQNALTPDTAKNLTDSFAPLFNEAGRVIEKSRGIVVTDAAQTLEIKLARECRLALRKIRVAGDKVRKDLKEDSLRRGKAIDGFYNILLHLTDEEERRLEEQEKFAERKEAERKAALKAEREDALRPYKIDTAFMQLGEMSAEAFDQFLTNTKLAHQAKIEAERRAEEERIRLENERLKEQARIRDENERLRREAEEREAAAKIERERLAKERAAAEEAARKEREAAEAERRRLEAEKRAIEEKARLEREAAEKAAAAAKRKAEEVARKERQAREAAEAQLRAQREAEAKRRQEEEAAQRKAAMAPDRDKLHAFADEIAAVEVGTLASDQARAVAVDASRRVAALVGWIKQAAEGLK